MYSARAYGWMSQLFKGLHTQHTHTYTDKRESRESEGRREGIKDDESKWGKKDEKSTTAVASTRGKWDMK